MSIVDDLIKNHGKKLLFFLPFWWDHVYSDFDPWTDTWTADDKHSRFLWELGPNPPFDGILFSRVKVESNKSRVKEIKKAGGIRNYLRLPKNVPLFGDCGAFGYINQDKPPFDPLETLDFYESMQYDLGCTVDHLIVKATEDQKYERFELTLRNAEKMMNKWSSGNYSFQLVGVAQGWDPESYYNAVKELLDMNFEYIALGGLVRTNTPGIVKVLKKCHELWKGKNIKVHVFGVGRWSIFPYYLKYGITSFDTAYHRRAWLSGRENYELNGKGYTAIRIPLSDPKGKRRIPEEQRVFDILKEFVEGKATPEKVIDALKAYEEKLVKLGIEKENRFERIKGLEEDYLRTLKERPWEKCDCPICKEIGIHVCIFRTNERNMRRGFHNLLQFYRRFQMFLKGELKIKIDEEPRYVEKIPFNELKGKKVLVITSCTAEKLSNSPTVKAKAKDMYRGRLFRNVKRLCKSMNWDYVIISAKYGLVFPDDEIKGYDKVLKTKEDIERIKPLVLPKLKEIIKDYDVVLVIAGKKYRKVIEDLIDDKFIILTSKGYGDLCSKVTIPSLTLNDFLKKR